MELRLKYPPTSEYAPRLAELAIDAARDISQIQLDFSVDSLHALDHLVGDFRDAGLGVDQICSTLFCFGCYLGEVLAQSQGGRWVSTEESPMANYSQWPMVIQIKNGTWWNPIGKVFKRFEDGPEESLPHFFETAVSSIPAK